MIFLKETEHMKHRHVSVFLGRLRKRTLYGTSGRSAKAATMIRLASFYKLGGMGGLCLSITSNLHVFDSTCTVKWVHISGLGHLAPPRPIDVGHLAWDTLPPSPKSVLLRVRMLLATNRFWRITFK